MTGERSAQETRVNPCVRRWSCSLNHSVGVAQAVGDAPHGQEDLLYDQVSIRPDNLQAARMQALLGGCAKCFAFLPCSGMGGGVGTPCDLSQINGA